LPDTLLRKGHCEIDLQCPFLVFDIKQQILEAAVLLIQLIIATHSKFQLTSDNYGSR